MRPGTWQRAEEIFHRVAAAPEAERAALLDEACGGDEELRAEVASLLEHDGRAGAEFLATPVLTAPDDDAPAWARALVGQRIGRYTVVRLIGHGGMGCVFEALQESPARAVALKVVRPGFSTAAALARFRLEPEVLGRLQHPHIAQVFEAGVHFTGAAEGEGPAPEPIPYFAMEYIAGARSLSEYVAEAGLGLRDRLALLAQVCDAVHHGHQKGIIHRDLKPGNILVGADGAPKVIDFGVARASDADVVVTTQHTQVGDLIGTVHYMSPEQCDGDPAAIDTRSDIYSLGVVLYELLTGTAPYDTAVTTLYRAIRVIKDEPPRRPSVVNRALRGDLEAIVLKALEKNPARRYVSASDLAADLRRHLAGEPIEARPPGAWRRLLRWAGRRPRTAAAVSAALLFGLSALGTIATLRAYVWYQLGEPVAVEYAPDRAPDKANLISRRGTVLHTWRATAGGTIGAVRMIQPLPHEPHRRLVLIGYHTRGAAETRCQLHVYDVRRDPARPLWTSQISDEDIPEALRAGGMQGGQFSPATVWALDVFPDADGEPRAEIICHYSHNTNSIRALRIYSLDGELLYQVWHDGYLTDCQWMDGPGLLVISGENWEAAPEERPCRHVGTTYNLSVIFALRPALGHTTPRLLTWRRAGQDAELAWYKWLGVCPIQGHQWQLTLIRPRDGEMRSELEVNLAFAADQSLGMSWRIDTHGDMVAGSLVAPTYRMALSRGEELPPLEAYTLQDRPPGE